MKLEMKDICKTFGEKEVLHGVSFSVESGKALGLLGRNGAGKTTTIRILMDVFRQNSGTITLDGQIFQAAEQKLGYLPEERGLYPKKSVIEQMIYLAKLRGVSKAEARQNSLKWLKRLELEQYETKKLETLSKGNQQKVQLASTLVSNPDIVILDEPFSGLDPVNAQILKDVVNELIAEGKIVIFSSHQMSYVEEFCEDIAIINHGEVVLSGRLSEIKKEFGHNQLVLNADNYEPQQLGELLSSKFSDIVTVNKVRKDGCIILCKDNFSKKELLKRFVDSELEIERFETYKPSLNDIFIAKVGEEE